MGSMQPPTCCAYVRTSKRLDTGALWIDEQRRVYNTADGVLMGVLTKVQRHTVDPEHLEYHRMHIAITQADTPQP
jgi:hypothetical protein